jgi:hypothetical protein
MGFDTRKHTKSKKLNRFSKKGKYFAKFPGEVGQRHNSDAQAYILESLAHMNDLEIPMRASEPVAYVNPLKMKLDELKMENYYLDRKLNSLRNRDPRRENDELMRENDELMRENDELKQKLLTRKNPSFLRWYANYQKGVQKLEEIGRMREEAIHIFLRADPSLSFNAERRDYEELRNGRLKYENGELKRYLKKNKSKKNKSKKINRKNKSNK